MMDKHGQANNLPCFINAIALFPQITKRVIAFPMSNPKVRSALLSESAIALIFRKCDRPVLFKFDHFQSFLTQTQSTF